MFSGSSQKENNLKSYKFCLLKWFDNSNKVITKNEYQCTKDTTYQAISHLGPVEKIMNEKLYIKPSGEVPDQIFDTPEVTTQVPKQHSKEKKWKMENPYACGICRGAFADPNDLRNHVEMHLRDSGVLEDTEVDSSPDSPTALPGPQGQIEDAPKTGLLPVDSGA